MHRVWTLVSVCRSWRRRRRRKRSDPCRWNVGVEQLHGAAHGPVNVVTVSLNCELLFAMLLEVPV